MQLCRLNNRPNHGAIDVVAVCIQVHFAIAGIVHAAGMTMDMVYSRVSVKECRAVFGSKSVDPIWRIARHQPLRCAWRSPAVDCRTRVWGATTDPLALTFRPRAARSQGANCNGCRANINAPACRTLQLFSSISATLGNAGQSCYASSNNTLDSAAKALHASGVPSTSLQWGPWSSIGMASRPTGLLDSLSGQGFGAVSPNAGLAAMAAATSSAAPSMSCIVLGAMDWDLVCKSRPSAYLSAVVNAMEPMLCAPGIPFSPLASSAARQAVLAIAEQILGSRVDTQASLVEVCNRTTNSCCECF